MLRLKADKKESNKVSALQYLKSLKRQHTGEIKSTFPRPTNFNLDLLIPPEPAPKGELSNQSTLLQQSTPTHRRQPSMMIRNLSQIYSFTHENTSFNRIFEEDSSKSRCLRPKNSIFASTTEPKSSSGSAKKSCLEVEERFIESENSEFAEIYAGVTKPDENYSTIAANTLEEIPELMHFSNLPCRAYCHICETDIITEVKLKMPTLPFWKVMCCIGTMVGLCTDVNDWDRFQEFQHSCRNCKSIIAVAQPV